MHFVYFCVDVPVPVIVVFCGSVLHVSTVGVPVLAATCMCGYHPSSPQDGTTVPVTLVYRGDLVRRDSPSPVLVHVYGMLLPSFILLTSRSSC